MSDVPTHAWTGTDPLAMANERAERWRIRCEDARATVGRVEALADWWEQDPLLIGVAPALRAALRGEG